MSDDKIIMSVENYEQFRLVMLRFSPSVLALHKAAWDAGYKVNGFKPSKAKGE